MKFRKKPVEIEAWQNTEGVQFPQWLDAAYRTGKVQLGSGGAVYIHTLEGTMKAAPGDWIIKGVQGELYPCKPDIFAQTYEQVAA